MTVYFSFSIHDTISFNTLDVKKLVNRLPGIWPFFRISILASLEIVHNLALFAVTEILLMFLDQFFIYNDGNLPAEVNFAFKKDNSNACFYLDPPKMTVSPHSKQELTLWAYPKQPGVYNDTVVMAIRDNPNPVSVNISCAGIKPEISVDRKIMQFEKVLLHRRTSQSLQLTNKTSLPIAWRVAGMENMGDEFSLNAEFGVLEPYQSSKMIMDFRALKAMTVKRNIRIEVGDIDNVLGEHRFSYKNSYKNFTENNYSKKISNKFFFTNFFFKLKFKKKTFTL